MKEEKVVGGGGGWGWGVGDEGRKGRQAMENKG